MSIATGPILTDSEGAEGFEQSSLSILLRKDWILRALSIIALGAAAVTLVLYLLSALNWRSQPFIGALFSTPSLVIEDAQPFSSENWQAHEVGMQSGDTLIGMDGVEWAADQRNEGLRETLQDYRVDERVELIVLHDGDPGAMTCEEGQLSCLATITLQQIPLTDFGLYFVAGYVVALAIVLMGGLVLWRRTDMRSAKLFAISVAALAIFNTGQFDLLTIYRYAPLWLVGTLVFSGVILSFGMTFPHDIEAIRRTPLLRYAPLLAAGGLSVITLWLYNESRYELFFNLSFFLLLASVIALIAIMGWRRQYSTSPIIREQVTFVGLGTLIGFFPILVRVLWFIFSGSEILHELIPISQVAVIFYALSVSYAILQYRLL
ncbi:MAG TPA: hypothetical protein VJZ27_00385, partial [Aggregatilineales bacterium]|nr:hypothetical protein [Aggregatilineales bacterium]